MSEAGSGPARSRQDAQRLALSPDWSPGTRRAVLPILLARSDPEDPNGYGTRPGTDRDQPAVRAETRGRGIVHLPTRHFAPAPRAPQPDLGVEPPVELAPTGA